jgi:methyltransferase, FkbM family
MENINSHTVELIEEAFEKVQEFNYKRYLEDLNTPVLQNIRTKKHPVNQIFEKFGLHIIRKPLLDSLERNLFSSMGKWSAVGTLQFALENPQKFDEVYNLLSDNDSKSMFDWFIQFRVAYAFVGEEARFVFPPKISWEDFKEKVSKIKLDLEGYMKFGKYNFLSLKEASVDSWIFEQYNLSGLCEVSSGDFVVDGGAFKGETAFWFLSKGAGKVYAFEGDDISFKVLSKNVRLNRVEGKIIPVKALLSDKDGVSKIKMTGSGSSSTLAKDGTEVESITLDSFVFKNNIEHIDFIKLDVEGAELDVLKGAIETIKKFKPKMAISVYHKGDDIVAIPLFLHELLPNAKFYLSHKNYTWTEHSPFCDTRGYNMKDYI